SFPPGPKFSTGHPLDPARLDELDKCRLADAHVAADLHEFDTALGDQPAHKPSRGTQPLGCYLDSEQPRRRSGNGLCCHAALPVTGTSSARVSLARRLASVSACSQWSRSATACSSRLLGGR